MSYFLAWIGVARLGQGELLTSRYRQVGTESDGRPHSAKLSDPLARLFPSTVATVVLAAGEGRARSGRGRT